MTREQYAVEGTVAQNITGFGTEDLVELGTIFSGAGLTSEESRALIQEVRQLAEQATLSMVPKLMDRVRRINQTRLAGVMSQIQLMDNKFGYVSRDQVLQLLSTLYMTPPRVGG